MNRPPSANPLRAPEQAGLSAVFASQTTVRARAVQRVTGAVERNKAPRSRFSAR